MSTILVDEKPTTKHGRLTSTLRQRILEGELLPGDKLPSFSEIRLTHGVTLSTIEKALSALERDGLIERLHGKGTFVRLKESSTKCLGFLCGKEGSFDWVLYWVAFMDGFREAAYAAGYDILLINPESSHAAWDEKVDGVIFHEMTVRDFKKMSALTPHVNILSSVPGHTCVVADEFGGAYLAVQHLLELGHERIAYLVDDSMWPTQMRLTGYRAALRDAGIAALPEWVRTFKDDSGGKLRTHWGNVEMRRWLAEGWRDLNCTALLCHNDETAMGVMEALREENIRVPEDLSLIGYDGTMLCETSRPRLTSLKMPMREIGSQAATLLIEQIEGKRPEPITISLPTALQIGDSTSRLAITM